MKIFLAFSVQVFFCDFFSSLIPLCFFFFWKKERRNDWIRFKLRAILKIEKKLILNIGYRKYNWIERVFKLNSQKYFYVFIIKLNNVFHMQFKCNFINKIFSNMNLISFSNKFFVSFCFMENYKYFKKYL